MKRIPIIWGGINISRALQDKFGLGKHGYQNADSLTSTPATLLDELEFNSVQESLVRVIEAAGLVPNGSDSDANYDQFRNAILSMINGAINTLWTKSIQGGDFLGRFTGAAYDSAGGVWVIVGQQGVIAKSTDDGATWTPQIADDDFVGDFEGVAWDSGLSLFCAVGNGTGGQEIQTSADGVTWTQRTVPFVADRTLHCVGSNDSSRFMVGCNKGDILTSTNGTTWTRTFNGTGAESGSNILRAVIYNAAENVWLLMGNQKETNNDNWRSLRSPNNGSTWSQNKASAGTKIVSVATDGDASGVYLFGGEDGSLWRGTGAFIVSKLTGGDVPAGTGRHGIHFAESLWVTTRDGDDKIYTSPDIASPFTWTERTLDTPGNVGAQILELWHGNSIFLGVGSLGEIQTSPDATTWTHREDAPLFTDDFLGAAFGNNIHVGVGENGEIQTSPNNILWTRRLPDSTVLDLNAVAFGNSLFVAVGNAGEIQSSANGIDWTQQTSAGPTADDFEAIVYDDNNNLFVAVGENGLIQTSADGITWTARTPAGAFAGTFHGVGYNGSSLVTIVGTTGEIQTSGDDITWTNRTPAGAFAGTFKGAAHKGATWIIVGSGGEIQSSGDAITWAQETADDSYVGTFEDVFSSVLKYTAIGTSGEIQGSLDGVTWNKETQANAFSGTFFAGGFSGLERFIVGATAEIQHLL